MSNMGEQKEWPEISQAKIRGGIAPENSQHLLPFPSFVNHLKELVRSNCPFTEWSQDIAAGDPRLCETARTKKKYSHVFSKIIRKI